MKKLNYENITALALSAVLLMGAYTVVFVDVKASQVDQGEVIKQGRANCIHESKDRAGVMECILIAEFAVKNILLLSEVENGK